MVLKDPSSSCKRSPTTGLSMYNIQLSAASSFPSSRLQPDRCHKASFTFCSWTKSAKHLCFRAFLTLSLLYHKPLSCVQYRLLSFNYPPLFFCVLLLSANKVRLFVFGRDLVWEKVDKKICVFSFKNS